MNSPHLKPDRQSTRPAPQRGRVVVYLLLLTAAVCAMAMLRRCSTPSPFATVTVGHSGDDTLDIAIEYSPVTLYRFDDTLGGPAYDMLRQMMERAGVPVKFHPVTSAGVGRDLLADGSVDLLVADMSRTSAAGAGVAFTRPVFLDTQVLVQLRSDSMVESALDLARRRVTVPTSSPMVHRLANLSHEIGDTIIIDIDTTHGAEQLLMMTAAGEIPLTVVTSRVAAAMAGRYPQLDASTRISFTQFQSWLTRSSDSLLLQRLDSLIGDYMSTPGYEATAARYDMLPARQ